MDSGWGVAPSDAALGSPRPRTPLYPIPRLGQTAFAGALGGYDSNDGSDARAAPAARVRQPPHYIPREADGSKIGAGEVRIGGLAPSPTVPHRPWASDP